MEKDQNSEALQIHRIKVAAGCALQRSPDSSAISQCQKTSCDIGHMIQQGMNAEEMSIYIACKLSPRLP